VAAVLDHRIRPVILAGATSPAPLRTTGLPEGRAGVSTGRRMAREAQRSTLFALLARLGFAVSGLLHVIVGVIAISVALMAQDSGAASASGAGGSAAASARPGPGGSAAAGRADETGALASLTATPLGYALLWAVVVGLAALGAWQITQTILVREDERRRAIARRVMEGSKALVFLVVAGSALIFALGGQSSAARTIHSLSVAAIEAPGGSVFLVLAGLIVLAVGITFGYRGVTADFRRDIRVPEGLPGRLTVAVGVLGHLAKGLALGIVGVLLVVAAFTADASQATGMDGALRALVALPYGGILLHVVGAGLIAYGLYALVRAPAARL
jgi:Domain of Unknown Function (DUF1206)